MLESLELRDVHLIGYSMGGRAALATCAAEPDRIASALLIGASAGIDDPDARAERIRADSALADRIERDGVAAFVDYWMAQPFIEREEKIGSAAWAEARRRRLENRPHALAASLRGMGAGAQPPLFGKLSRIDRPICFAVGERDAKFRAIASGLQRRLADARLAIVPDAGHAAHLENPVAFLGIARRFWADVESTTRPSQPAAGAAAQLTTRSP